MNNGYIDHVVTKIRINVTFSIFRYVVYKLNFYIIFAPFEVLCFLATYVATMILKLAHSWHSHVYTMKLIWYSSSAML